MTLSIKCQYINDHYQLLVQLHSIIAQSTPSGIELHLENSNNQLFQRTITILELPGLVSSPQPFPTMPP